MQTQVVGKTTYKTVSTTKGGHVRCMIRVDGGIFIQKTENGVSTNLMCEIFHRKIKLTRKNIDETLLLLADSSI